MQDKQRIYTNTQLSQELTCNSCIYQKMKGVISLHLFFFLLNLNTLSHYMCKLTHGGRVCLCCFSLESGRLCEVNTITSS